MLKEREAKILEYMKEQIATKGYPPTVREICAALGIKSTSTVHKDIENLAIQGYLVKDPSKTRALMVVDPDNKEKHIKPGVVEANSNVVEIPIVGRVAAGVPILAEQNIEDSFPIPARFVNGGTNFMLKVKGESMIDVGIMDGDLILVEQNEYANNGEIVVAMVEDNWGLMESTVKRFYKEDGHIRLQPENSTMKPIIVDDAKIIGKVKGVFRYFN